MERGSVPANRMELQMVLLAWQLELRQPAILECAAPRVARQRWREMTLAARHRFTLVECVCTDSAVHRARFEQRHRNTRRDASGWDQMAATTRRYQPDQHAGFAADAVRPAADLVTDIVDLVHSQA
jgi:hypothetical protein